MEVIWPPQVLHRYVNVSGGNADKLHIDGFSGCTEYFPAKAVAGFLGVEFEMATTSTVNVYECKRFGALRRTPSEIDSQDT